MTQNTSAAANCFGSSLFVCVFVSFFRYVLTYYNPQSLSLETKRSRNTIIVSWHSTQTQEVKMKKTFYVIPYLSNLVCFCLEPMDEINHIQFEMLIWNKAIGPRSSQLIRTQIKYGFIERPENFRLHFYAIAKIAFLTVKITSSLDCFCLSLSLTVILSGISFVFCVPYVKVFQFKSYIRSVSIKYGLRTTDRLGIKQGLGYETWTKYYGLGIKYGLRCKTRTEHYGLFAVYIL